jgi:dTDP-4-amino-4,6-dideoxyglucose
MRKKSVCDLARFGGPRLFTRPRSIAQLDAPPVEDYLAVLRESFDARYLSNGGPLVRRLEDRLRDYHQVRHCIAVANAALGLTMLIQLFARGRVGEVIMPAFSYRGLPHFAVWAGQTPRFCDADPVTHGLDPTAVEDCISNATTSILAVCNDNSPGLLNEICSVGERHGIPVIVDSVYGLGATYQGKMLGSIGHAEVYSTHATKLMNGFEGGYITTNDDALADLLRWQRNFALRGLHPASADGDNILGLNAKLNELHAALALLSLDRLGGVIERNKARHDAYRVALASIDGLDLLPHLNEAAERRSYAMAVVGVDAAWPLTRETTMKLLQAEGCLVGAYYSPPLHISWGASPHIQSLHLPVTERLAARYIKMPGGELTSLEDIAEIGTFLEFVRDNHTEISRRLEKAT